MLDIQTVEIEIEDFLNSDHGEFLEFNTLQEIEDYFYDYFREIYGVDDKAMYYVDIERFINDLIVGGDITIYETEDNYIVEFNY